MSKEWDAMWADIEKHSCKICGIYKCRNHLPEEWIVCPDCPGQSKYWLKYHSKCPHCGAGPTVTKEKA